MSSDDENNEPTVEVSDDEQDGAEAAASSGPLSTEDALKIVLKNALISDGLARGLREVTKALDSKRAHLCVLANDCTEQKYQDLIRALCKTHSIPLMTVPAAKTLGEWAGLCKIDAEGNPRKVVAAASVALTSWGKESEARGIIQEYLKTQTD
jgi:small subunit ribosomal protein S12e